MEHGSDGVDKSLRRYLEAQITRLEGSRTAACAADCHACNNAKSERKVLRHLLSLIDNGRFDSL